MQTLVARRRPRSAQRPDVAVKLVGAFSVLLMASGAGGCAVGYGLGVTSHSASAASDPRAGIVEDGPIKFSATYQEFRIIDSTGIVLAALVNAGRQYNARADAIKQAEYQTPDSNGVVKVEYSYEPMPILAGLLTDLRIRVPLGTPSIEMPTGTDTMREVEYWAFDLRPEFYTFRPIKSLPMVSSLWLNVEVEDWNAPDLSGVDADLVEIDMGFGSSTSYVVRDGITATGRIGIGVLTPIFAAIAGGSKFNPNAEVEVGWRPWHSGKLGLQVSAVGYLGREMSAGRSITASRLGLNAALTIGNQVPKKARRDQAPDDSIDPNAPLSGGVCLGPTSPADCKIVDALPDVPKILYLACAQAAMNAANTSDFSTQPNACRKAGAGITNFRVANQGSLDAGTDRALRIAAATMFDLAGAGYEVTTGKLTADHCAMIEATYDNVVGADPRTPTLPTRVKVVDRAVTQCRPLFTCAPAQDDGVTCTSNAPP